MAELRIRCAVHDTVHQVVSVPNVTSMGYAALHVAEAVGADPYLRKWALLDARSERPVPDSDLAADWDGMEVYLAWERA